MHYRCVTKANLQLLLVSQSLRCLQVVHELPLITVKMLPVVKLTLFINFIAKKSNEKFAT